MWKGFQKPKRLAVDPDSLTDTYGSFNAQPFERGFGTTIGNSLRRALLSSIEGGRDHGCQDRGHLPRVQPDPGRG